jgi:hypothetical protein
VDIFMVAVSQSVKVALGVSHTALKIWHHR